MKRLYIFLTLITAICLQPTKAINGYHMMGYGTLSKGMGGVGAAYYRASIISNNPAGRAFLGKQYSASATFLFPSTSYNVSGTPSGAPGTIPLAPGKVESDISVLFVPNLGANWQLSDNAAFGVSLYGSGIATDYPTQTFGDPTSSSTGVNFKQLYLDPTLSLKLGEKHALGFSALLMYQSFEVEGLNSFGAMPLAAEPVSLSTDATKLSGNGADSNFGVGFKIGYMGEIINGLHIGAYYQSRTWAGEMKEYSGLLAEQGDFDAPSNWTIGLNYEISDKFKVLFDVQKINFSEVNALGNKLMPLLVTVGSGFANTDGLLGNDEGAGFGWEDMTIFKLGAEYDVKDHLTLRAGYSFGEEPVRESEVLFNTMAPVVNNQHISLGVTKRIGAEKSKAINLALVYAPANNVKGANPLDPAQQIELELGVFEIELGITF